MLNGASSFDGALPSHCDCYRVQLAVPCEPACGVPPCHGCDVTSGQEMSYCEPFAASLMHACDGVVTCGAYLW